MKKIIIAIDGFSGCGKSTLARQLAEKLHYIYIDTGAMYRAITLYLIENNYFVASLEHKQDYLSELLKEVHLEFVRNENTQQNDMMLNGKNVEKEIRKIKVADRVSEVAALAEVRKLAVDAQKRLAEQKGVVMDGRDIGTVVFPNAELKLFLTASIEVRVERRYKEYQRKGVSITRTEVRKNLEERDYKDSHRKESPLRQAQDAVVIDNSMLSRDEQLEKALLLAGKAIG